MSSYVFYSDDFTEMIVEKMRENPEMVKLGSIIASIVLILGVLVSVMGRNKPPTKSTSSKKKDQAKKKS